MWVYWKERCNYCVNREECKYKEKVLELMDILDDDEKDFCLKNHIYGTLDWKCDYFFFDDRTNFHYLHFPLILLIA
jgi:hypothetical protein